MLVVETIAKIRRAYFIQGKLIKQICRELQVSRNRVRKVVRFGTTGFSYDRSRQPRTKIDPWRSELAGMPADADTIASGTTIARASRSSARAERWRERRAVHGHA